MTLRLSQRLRLAVATAALLPLLPLVGLSHQAVAGTQDTALTMVQRYDFGRNLQSIGLNVARDSRAYPAIVQALGDHAGDTLVHDKLVQFAPKYQEQWDANLAAAYSAVYTEEELRSFADQGAASDRIADFNAKRGDVGSIMRDKSQALLNAYVTDALNSAARAARESAAAGSVTAGATNAADAANATPQALTVGAALTAGQALAVR
ncbi:hypothetical protein OVY01_11305 [Robbsia sp. Bb-Pol-6]|uniref:DUF2059 domain-containing protein n=1 Tax=Robbsia betulipollinis TaxID=2981849 RepID=A0ABT3ZNI1_9BURK|nr:hypothetical protein [Robbsia betulipollinis]MCY0387810.1 hypothetical protein [Robbsia betulipollinis]